MKIIEGKDVCILDDVLNELERLTCLLGFMQTAYAGGDFAIEDAETAAALYHIYSRQGELIKQIKALYDEE